MTIICMTASEKPVNHIPDNTPSEPSQTITPPSQTQDAPAFPGVLLLLRKTLLIIWGLRVPIYGYAAWLLIPIVLGVFIQNVPSPYGNYLLTIRDALSLLLNLWVTGVIIVFVTHMLLTKNSDHQDFTEISKRAWNSVLKLFLVQTCVVILVILGSAFLVIPGIVAWVWTAFAAPDAVLNDRGLWQTFQHSYQLTRHRFWGVFGRLFIGNGLLASVTGGLLVLYALAGLQGSSGSLLATFNAWPAWLQTGLSLILVLIMPVVIVYQLVLYIAAETTYSQPTEDQK